MKSSRRLAIVYDRINKWGGAERVLQSLHRAYPRAPIFTAVYHPQGAPWAAGWDIRPSFLNRLPLASSHHEWLAPFTPLAFKHFDFSQFDVVISVTSAEAKGIVVKRPTKHICYLLTPTRYLWHQTHQHRGRGVGAFFRLPILSQMRLWDYQAAQKPDHFIAISHAVAARCQKYYRRNVAAVIYPPVDISKFQSHPELCFTKNRDYFLIVSRLVAHKHVSDAIEAFKQMPQEKLVIVGTGNHVSKLKRQALGCQNIIFKGKVTDAALSCLYHHAQALIFPQEEDFGITAVEAHASGTPVIAYNRGAAPEIISHGQTGILYAEQTPAAIINAVKKCQQQSLSAKDCYRNAQKFDKNEFTRQFNQTLERLCPNLKSQ